MNPKDSPTASERADYQPSAFDAALIAAAEKHATAYDDDDREQIKTDVLNAFFAGATWLARSRLAAATAARCQNCDDTGDVHSVTGEWRGVCHCPAGRRISAPAEPAPEPWIERSIYHKAEQYSEYLAARFPRDGLPRGNCFWWQGHNWRYRVTSFDDVGEFDIIERPASAEPAATPVVPPSGDIRAEDDAYYRGRLDGVALERARLSPQAAAWSGALRKLLPLRFMDCNTIDDLRAWLDALAASPSPRTPEQPASGLCVRCHKQPGDRVVIGTGWICAGCATSGEREL